MSSDMIYQVLHNPVTQKYKVIPIGYFTSSYDYKVRYDGIHYYTEVDAKNTEDALTKGIEKIDKYLPERTPLPPDKGVKKIKTEPKKCINTRQLIIHRTRGI